VFPRKYKDAVILVSNENEKPFVNLERIVNGYDKYIKILPTDTVFYLDPVSTNSEKISVKLSDEIAKMGAKAISLSSKTPLIFEGGYGQGKMSAIEYYA